MTEREKRLEEALREVRRTAEDAGFTEFQRNTKETAFARAMKKADLILATPAEAPARSEAASSEPRLRLKDVDMMHELDEAAEPQGGRCPKCGGERIIQYRLRRDIMPNRRYVVGVCYEDCPEDEEHFDRTCRQCGFRDVAPVPTPQSDAPDDEALVRVYAAKIAVGVDRGFGDEWLSRELRDLLKRARR